MKLEQLANATAPPAKLHCGKAQRLPVQQQIFPASPGLT
jgi:hypothetical protein